MARNLFKNFDRFIVRLVNSMAIDREVMQRVSGDYFTTNNPTPKGNYHHVKSDLKN
jgi:hypothetical protein